MPDVVQRVTHPGVCHPQTLIHFIEEHRDQGGLPVVAVDDVRMLVCLEQELQRRPTEKSESFSVIGLAVKDAAVEKIGRRTRIDEEALQAVHETEINITRHPMGNKEPTGRCSICEPRDAIIAQAIVFGQ
jgi:hypothetical protein